MPKLSAALGMNCSLLHHCLVCSLSKYMPGTGLTSLIKSVANASSFASTSCMKRPTIYPGRSIACRHRLKMEMTSNGSSINGKVGTPLGSKNVLVASMCLFTPLKVT